MDDDKTADDETAVPARATTGMSSSSSSFADLAALVDEEESTVLNVLKLLSRDACLIAALDSDDS